MDGRRLRVLVADDHAVVRKGVVHILNSTPDLAVGGEAATGTELTDLVQKEEWDAVVMDLHMPGISGLDLLKQLRSLRPRLPVLILTVQPEDIYARRLLQAGAAGYLTKESLTGELVGAVRKVCAGGHFVSQGLLEQMAFRSESNVDRAPHEGLSGRELEVLRLLASGLTPTQIAEKLYISVKTVSTYRARILEKMHMRTNAEIMKYAIKAGLVE